MTMNDAIAAMAIEGHKRIDARANGQTVSLPDGYNGATLKFYATPIARDGALIKLLCAEPGKEYMTKWAVGVDVIKAMEEQR